MIYMFAIITKICYTSRIVCILYAIVCTSRPRAESSGSEPRKRGVGKPTALSFSSISLLYNVKQTCIIVWGSGAFPNNLSMTIDGNMCRPNTPPLVGSTDSRRPRARATRVARREALSLPQA